MTEQQGATVIEQLTALQAQLDTLIAWNGHLWTACCWLFIALCCVVFFTTVKALRRW